MKRFSIFFLLFFTAIVAKAELNWHSDINAAREAASEQNKYLLLEFTGSAWCPPCKALARDVLEQAEFRDYALANLVLLKLDFPRKVPENPSAQVAHNNRLAAQYNVQGFPTLILLDPSGTEVARDVGYAGKPAEIMIWLKKNVKP